MCVSLDIALIVGLRSGLNLQMNLLPCLFYFLSVSDLPSDVMAHPMHCVKLSIDPSVNGDSCEL